MARIEPRANDTQVEVVLSVRDLALLLSDFYAPGSSTKTIAVGNRPDEFPPTQVRVEDDAAH